MGLVMDNFLIRGAAAAPGPGALAKAAEDAARTSMRRSSATKWLREHLHVVRRRLWRWRRVAAHGTGRLEISSVRAVAWARLKRR